MARAMRLNDGVVELRAPRRSDITELHRAIHASMPELLPWMAWAHPGYTDNEASEWVRRAARAFADGVEFQFVARELEHGQLLGTVGLNTIDRVNRWANLGYWLATPHTGRGYMTRAAQLVVDLGFSELALGRIEILAAVQNLPSQGVARRLGAQREGVLRNRLRVREERQDAAVFSLIDTDGPNS